MATAIGKLRHLVTIQQDNGSIVKHEHVPSWGTLASVRASIEDVGGGELVQGVQMDAMTNRLVMIRWRGDVTPRMRVLFGLRELNIASVNNRDGRRKWLFLQCVEDV